MATEPILISIAEGTAAGRQPWFDRWLAAAPDYWALTKPEVNFLIVICTFAGFYLGYPVHPKHVPWVRLTHTLLGTLLVASGTGTLNQYLESLSRASAMACLREEWGACPRSPGSSSVHAFGRDASYPA